MHIVCWWHSLVDATKESVNIKFEQTFIDTSLWLILLHCVTNNIEFNSVDVKGIIWKLIECGSKIVLAVTWVENLLFYESRINIFQSTIQSGCTDVIVVA